MSTLKSICISDYLPDGLVKFLKKEAHCYIGWVVQSVLSKRVSSLVFGALKCQAWWFSKGSRSTDGDPLPFFPLPNVRSNNQPDLFGSLKDTDCLPSLYITPGKYFYAQLINRNLNSNTPKKMKDKILHFSQTFFQNQLALKIFNT